MAHCDVLRGRGQVPQVAREVEELACGHGWSVVSWHMGRLCQGIMARCAEEMPEAGELGRLVYQKWDQIAQQVMQPAVRVHRAIARYRRSSHPRPLSISYS